MTALLNRVRREASVAEYIPYGSHVTPNIVSTKAGDYVSVWKIGGRSHQAASSEDLFVWANELNQLIKTVAGPKVSFWAHVVRRQVSGYPGSEFANAFCRDLDRKYRQRFADNKTRINELYLSVVYRPVADAVLSIFSRTEKPSMDDKAAMQSKNIAALEEINRVIAGYMSRYNAELLGTYDHNGHAFSAPAEFFGFLVNGKYNRVPLLRDRIANYLAEARPIFSKFGEVGELRDLDCTTSFGMLEISDYPAATEPGHLNCLLECNFDFVLSQSFSALSKHAATEFLKRHKQHLQDTNDVVVSQVVEIDEAMDQLGAGVFVMGEHHCTLTVFAESADQVRGHLSVAKTALGEVGIKASGVDLALEAGYWAQLPGNWKYRPRPKPITSLNFVSFASFHNFLTGKAAGNPWGPAVTVFKTTSDSALHFNFHATLPERDDTGKRALGNTAIIGQSGSGKTALLAFLAAQTTKFDPTMVLFDAGRGLEVAVRAMGGKYLPLFSGAPTGFNPFALTPTRGNMIFLKRFIKTLIGADGNPIRVRDEEEIDQALNTVMFQLDRPARRLAALLQSLPNPPFSSQEQPTVHARLLKWCAGGDYGWVFDNAEDLLDLNTHRIYGFNIADFMENHEIRPALIMYLLYRTEAMIDGRRFLYLFDEFQQALKDEYFQEFVQAKQRLIRKQNGLLVFATQEPGAVLDSPIAKTLVQQCATFAFLPNPRANHDEYTSGFGLTESEFQIVAGLGESSRRFLVKQEGLCAVARLDLSGFDDELLVLSGTADHADIASEVITEVGDSPEVWLPIYLQRVRESEQKIIGRMGQ